jgi:radical SAM protein with 4Fe4S-binding SPASM domain
MFNEYLHWNKDLEIRKYETGISLLAVKNNCKDEMLTKKDIQTYTLNDIAVEIIELIDGTKSYDEIAFLLSSKYNESSESIKEKLNVFFEQMLHSYGIKINEQDSPQKINISVVERKSIYPQVASIEITNKCNIRCIHCYGDFGCIESKVMTLDQVKALLDDLKSIGVRIIELTGGDVTVHPHIKEILLYALELKFDQISFLTNGVAISNEVIDIIIKNKSSIYAQIDLHSLNDEYLTWFTKVSNTLELVKKNIIKLAEGNVKMRIATIVTRKNMDEIEYIADWVHNLGISHYGISPVISMGRASNSDSDLYLNLEDLNHVNEKLERINEKYKNFLSIIQKDRSLSKSCGCLTSHVVIAPSGDIKICTMDNLEYFNSSIGNVLEKNIKDIYDDNAEYVNNFLNTPAPIFDSSECKECENISFCSNCILRGLIKASEMNGECSWYSNKVNSTIKEKLELEKITVQ